MPKPTADEIRVFLEGYGVTKEQLSDKWIENRRDNFIIPIVNRVTKLSFEGIQTITEFHSGNGGSLLFLNKRPVVALVDIYLVTYNDVDTRLGIANIDVLAGEGILKSIGVFENYPYISIFPKGSNNLKIIYTAGYADYPPDVSEAVIYLCAEQALGFIGSRTGGGSPSGQAYSRQFGNRGKYTEARSDLARQAHALLQKYITHVSGS